MEDRSTWGWHGLCFRSMNTRVEIQLYSDDGVQAMSSVRTMFDKVEKSLSRFDPSSELCKLNQSAGRRQRVSKLLFDALQAALWAASDTGGLFDPTVLHAMQAIGYDRSFEHIAPSNHEQPASSRPGWKNYERIELNRLGQEIYLPPDLGLDLGGIGKGWTVDRAADWLAGRGPFLINAGGDLYGYGSPPGQPGWSIGIVDPWEPERDLIHLQVHQRAVATSTISRRRWQRGNHWLHHLIDPRTGQPADTDVVSATVIAHRVALAEVYAKTALIMGAAAGRDWLNRMPDVEGLLVHKDGQLIMTDRFSDYTHMQALNIEVRHDDSSANQSFQAKARRPDSSGHRRYTGHRSRAADARGAAG